MGKPVNITHTLQREYFKLDIVICKPGAHYEKHTEFHFAFLKETLQKRRISKTSPEDQLNIAVVLIDSLSHAHAQRSLKKTYSFLKVFFSSKNTGGPKILQVTGGQKSSKTGTSFGKTEISEIDKQV